MKKERGLTLLEILIATSILVVMVGFLVAIVNSFMGTWQRSYYNSILFAEARRVFETIQEDLQALAVGSFSHKCRLVGDFDTLGRFRLRLVRPIYHEEGWWEARKSGQHLLADKYIDSDQDIQEASQGRLKPTAGWMEVMYAMDPNPHSLRLHRIVRTPVGGEGSLLAPRPRPRVWTPFLDNVLYLEFRYWSPWTRSWEIPLRRMSQEELRGTPLLYWDSQRKGEQPPIQGQFPIFRPPQHLLDHPVLPEKVMVILVLRRPDWKPDAVVLAEDIGPNSLRIPLSAVGKVPQEGTDFRFVRLSSSGGKEPQNSVEWVHYSKVVGSSLVLENALYRGARGTQPIAHLAGTSVEVGKTFCFVISLMGTASNIEEQR
ncbi:MAG: type II secretion system protein [Planctomycetota bacterium]|nr:MAG: type II secretion system protein [Planctomycetota bacterium]